MKKHSGASAKAEVLKARQSVTFTKQQHDALSYIATRNKVSVCWVVRHACDLLIQEQGKSTNLLTIEDKNTNE